MYLRGAKGHFFDSGDVLSFLFLIINAALWYVFIRYIAANSTIIIFRFMKRLLKPLCVFLFILLADHVVVQAQFMNDVAGRPIRTNKYVEVDGFPFLLEKWSKGEASSDKGVTSKNLELKYDVVDDRVTFKSEKGDEMEFVNFITSFTLYGDNGNRNFKRFSEIKEYSGVPFFEVLNEGDKLKLLKKTAKTVMETKAFNSATATKTFSESVKYFLLKKDGTYERIKKDKKSIAGAMADKAAEVEAFIKTNKTDFKKDDQIGALVTYYNGL